MEHQSRSKVQEVEEMVEKGSLIDRIITALADFLRAWLKAKVEDTKTEPTKPNAPPVVEVPPYIVTGGVRIERRVSKPGSLSFTMTPRRLDVFNPELKNHVCWAYSKKFTGGQDNPDFEAGCRSYKMKVYNAGGQFNSEPRINFNWLLGVPVRVVFSWTETSVAYKLGDLPPVVVMCEMPKNEDGSMREFTVGYGWPPSTRNGMLEAELTDIVWE